MAAVHLDTVNGVIRSAMAFASLARLLFALALLTQVAAGAFAPAQSGGSRLCGLTHSEARSPSFVGDATEQAPQRESGHRHGACSFCLFGSGDPPLYTRPIAVEPRRTASAERRVVDYADGLLLFHVDRNASARAPPSFS
jgi:hypothetical protein